MADMKKGVCNGVRVQLGRLQQLMATSCIEHLDFVHPEDVADPPNPFKDSRDRATSAQGPSVHRQQTFVRVSFFFVSLSSTCFDPLFMC